MTYLDEVAASVRAHVPAGTEIPADTDDLFRLYAVLACVKGIGVTNEDVHDAWVAWMSARHERHGAMVPFADLPDDVRDQDEPFTEAIRATAADRGPSTTLTSVV